MTLHRPLARRRFLALALLLPLLSCDSAAPPPAAAPTAASAPAAGPRYRFGFVSNNTSTFWNIASKGLEKARRELNVDPLFRAPQNGQLAEQQQIIEDLLSQGVDGIAVSPINPEGQVELLNRAAAKVALICHDSDAPKSDRLCYIGTHNYNAGREAGKAMKEALGEAGGKVAIFVGRLDAQNARDRRQGFLDEVAGTKIQAAHDYTDDTDRSRAKQNAEDALNTYPDLAALLGLWSYNGPAIAAAVRGANKTGRVKVVCFDEEDGALQAVQDGIVYATVVQKPFEFGYQSMKVLQAIKQGRAADVIPPDKVVDTGVLVVKKENVEEFWKNLKELTK